MGSVILWMTIFTYDAGKMIVQERFTSIESCERFVQEFRVSSGEKPVYKGHFCYQDR